MEFDIDVEQQEWMEGVNSGVFYDSIEAYAKHILNKKMDENKELCYTIEDIGYEQVK